MFEVFSGIADAILVVAAAMAAAIVTVAVMIVLSESLGNWKEAIRNPLVFASWILAAAFAAWLAAKVVLMNL